MRKKLLKWLISILLPGFHLSKNPVGGGRKKIENPLDNVIQTAQGLAGDSP